MKENGASNSRIANVISAVKWLIGRLQKDGKIPTTLDLEKVKKPRIGRNEVNYLNESEIQMFVACIQKDIEKGIAIRKVRFMALALLLLLTGCRIGEALSINIKEINWQNQEIEIIGKGGNPRTLVWKKEILDCFKRYIKIRKSHHKALFTTLDGKSRWEQTDAGRSFRRYREMSGITKRFTAHTLRHTLATQLLSKGAKINEIQFILGHSNLDTTVKYYLGSIEKQRAREILQDDFFNPIPQAIINTYHKQNAQA
jgi:integrase/recombinase XerD